MTTCDRIQADAPGLASLRVDDPERLAAQAHASRCPRCARALREADRLQALIAAHESAPLPLGALERTSREIQARLFREARRRVAASVVGVCASVAVFVTFARSRSRSPADWALAAILWASAVLLATAASRRPRLVTALAVTASAAVALFWSGPGPLAPLLGLECVATEVASAGMVLGAVWLALRREGTSLARPVAVALAAAGALGGGAALQVTCHAHTSSAHMLAFHVGGVVLAAAGASALLGRRPHRVTA